MKQAERILELEDENACLKAGMKVKQDKIEELKKTIENQHGNYFALLEMANRTHTDYMKLRCNRIVNLLIKIRVIKE